MRQVFASWYTHENIKHTWAHYWCQQLEPFNPFSQQMTLFTLQYYFDRLIVYSTDGFFSLSLPLSLLVSVVLYGFHLIFLFPFVALSVCFSPCHLHTNRPHLTVPDSRFICILWTKCVILWYSESLLIVGSVQLNFPLFRSYIFLMAKTFYLFDSEDAVWLHQTIKENENH